MNKVLLCFSIIVALVATSCSTTKNTSYFQTINEQQISKVSNKPSMLFRANDEISIIVSSVDPAAAAAFNLTYAAGNSTSAGKSTTAKGAGISKVDLSGTPALQTYIVDENGFINFPTLGKLKVAGLSKTELVDDLEKRLSEYIKDPIVNVKLMNFRIAVLGEVNAPGDYSFSNQRVSILDALATAQDLTPYGVRENVLLIRDVDGKQEFIRFDLTKSDLFTSEHFFLQQNDVLYIEPNGEKQKEANVGLQKQYNLTVTTSIISYVISTASLIVALLVR